jgi:hypothetical protein
MENRQPPPATFLEWMIAMQSRAPQTCALCGISVDDAERRQVGGHTFCGDADGCRVRSLRLLESARSRDQDLRARLETLAGELPSEYAERLKIELVHEPELERSRRRRRALRRFFVSRPRKDDEA